MTRRPPLLGTRLRRQFLLLGVVPVLAVFIAAWALVVPTLVQQAEARNRELALAVRDQVRLQLDVRLRSAEVLAQSLRQTLPPRDTLQSAIQGLLQGDRFLQAVYVADAQGEVIEAALPVQGGRFAEDAVGLDLSGQPYFTAARRGGGPVWSDTFLSTLTGNITAVLAVPAGAHTVVVELSLAALSESLVEVADSGKTLAVVLDRAGRIIAHPDARKALQQDNLGDLPVLRAALGGAEGNDRVTLDGAQMFVHALPAAALGWTVFAAQPVALVLAPLLQLGAGILVVLFVSVLVAVLVGWRMARQTGIEITRLADGAQAAAGQGGFMPELMFSNAEFNAVWTRLRELFQQLHLREKQTSSAQQDLQSVLDAATEVAIIATDTQGQVTVFNIGAQRMLGYRHGEVLSRLTPLAWHDAAEVAGRAEALSRKYGQSISGFEALVIEARHSGYEVRDWRFTRSDGVQLDVSVAVTSMRTPEGDLKGFLSVAVDVSERRRAAAAELARQTAELASQAKSDFLSHMSHELRTPLNAILGFAQLLEIDPETPPTKRQQEFVQHIQRAGWHLVRLIDDVLDLARIESGRLQVTVAAVDSAAVIAQAAQMVAPQMREHGVTLLLQPTVAGAPRVAADATRLLQVLVNLLSNAAKYNRRGGSVQLECEALGGQMVLRVIDTGRGMTPDQLAHLFEPFNRLGRDNSGIQGTGIGLVITRHLVEMMQGRLELRSESGVGTTAIVTLPVAEAPPPAIDRAADGAASAGAAAKPARSIGRVLYIEDNEVNAQLVRAILRQRPDLDLTTFALGLAGLEAARADPPDLILLDIHLSDARGEDLLDAMQADPRLRQVPVVVVSADATRDQAKSMLMRGALAYLTKPLEVAEALRVIDMALNSRATTRV